jgi:pyrroline-5-carboxylate reductase
MLTERIGFIGAGKMGGILIKGILKNRLVSPKNLWICDKFIEKLISLEEEGANVFVEIEPVVKNADVLFLAIKPQDISGVLEHLRGRVQSGQLIISLVAGVTTSLLIKELGDEISLIRIMPNAPALLGEGITAISSTKRVNPEQRVLLRRIMATVGEVVEIPESQQNAVTGLSGSGPAYIYTVIQGLVKGGVSVGLSPELALRLATQTTLGAARMAKESNSSLEELRQAVASPGGTTIEGLKVLKEGRLEECLAEAVVKAAQRAKELNK